jgi:hypothetical protein
MDYFRLQLLRESEFDTDLQNRLPCRLERGYESKIGGVNRGFAGKNGNSR